MFRTATVQAGEGVPFFNARDQVVEYLGPGRETPPPHRVKKVLIGYFGPSDPDDPQAGDLWRAAQAAIERANNEGGCGGAPFELAPVWSPNPWGTGIRELARLVYDLQVWAVIGGVDGPTTHLAEQVAAKARLPLVSPLSTDKTVNLANVPWMFSLAPPDHRLAEPLATELVSRVGDQMIVLVSADDHDSRMLSVELKKALARRAAAPHYEFQHHRGGQRIDELVARLLPLHPAAVAIVADADDSARFVTRLRAGGYEGELFGGPAMGRRRFLEQAGGAAEGAVFPLLADPESLAMAKGNLAADAANRAEAEQLASDVLCDDGAALMFDAVTLLVNAVRHAGLNRARIRDAMEDLSPWSGASGLIRWDNLGANSRPVRLGAIHTAKESGQLPLSRKTD